MINRRPILCSALWCAVVLGATLLLYSLPAPLGTAYGQTTPSPPAAPAQPPADPSAAAQPVARPSIAELRSIVALRDLEQGGGSDTAVVAAARAHLAQHGQGRYADEVLLTLSRALQRSGQQQEALASYERLIERYPDSPFREQAYQDSLPLVEATRGRQVALERARSFFVAFPDSVQGARVRLFQARAYHDGQEHERALAALQRIESPEALPESERPAYRRLAVLTRVNSGLSAWEQLRAYLRTPDTVERKAEVLMTVAAVARKGGREAEALGYYEQVVQTYPAPDQTSEALYWRAELYRRTELAQPEALPPAKRAELSQLAVARYGAYLDSSGNTMRPEALTQRGHLLRDTGETDAALADYAEAVRLRPALGADPEMLEARVALLTKAGRTEEALALLEAEFSRPGIPPERRTELRIRQAALHYQAGRCEPVEALLNPMPITRSPEQRSRAFFIRGFCRYRSGEWQQATFDLEGLVNDPQYQPLVLEPLLVAYERSGQHSRLVNLAEELLQSGRVAEEGPLLLRLADGYARLDEPALMLNAYARLDRLDPTALRQPELQMRLGRAQERVGSQARALEHYALAMELLREDGAPLPAQYVDALAARTRLLTAQGRHEEALAAAEIDPQRIAEPEQRARLTALQAEAHLGVARAALSRRDPQAALPHLEQAAALLPQQADGPQAGTQGGLTAAQQMAALQVGALAMAERHDEALQRYNAALERYPDSAQRQQISAEVLAVLEAPALPRTPSADPSAQSGAAMAEPKRPAAKGAEAQGSQVVAGAESTEVAAALPPALRSKQARPLAIALLRTRVEASEGTEFQPRYAAARQLDALYTQDGDFANRAALVTLLLKDGADELARRDLKRYQGRIYKDWGEALLERKQPDQAYFQFKRALPLLGSADRRERYEVVSGMSQVLQSRKDYSDLVLLNEELLTDLPDEAQATAVRRYVGQIYLDWAKAADTEHNGKSALIRYQRALDYLPPQEWQRRLAAANGLAGVYGKQGQEARSVAVYEAVLADVPESPERRRYALYLGRLLRERIKQPAQAGPWLQQADGGGNDAISLEAGYLLADLMVDAKQEPQAIKALEGLVGRDLRKSQWLVPIHYRLAVLYHRSSALEPALRNYRIVAAVKSAELVKLYARSIEQSREQAERIARYLESGGSGGGGISVPKISAG